MAEVKNAFIKSKMNKDLEARLLPSGEYRDGQNVAVSRSEGPNVGALETILGNEFITKLFPPIGLDFTFPGTSVNYTAGNTYLQISGFSGVTDYIFKIFPNQIANISGVIGTVTEYTPGAGMHIVFNNATDAANVAQNFATMNCTLSYDSNPNAPINKPLKIIGTNQDLTNEVVYIFATDYTDESNNGLLNLSVSVGTDYDNTDKCGTGFIFKYNLKTPTVDPQILVFGSFLNFAKNFKILNSNLLENLLFWTDNRNQPRVINVETASESATWKNPYYFNEDHVSVAKFAPYQPIELWKEYPQAEAGYNFTGDSTQTTMRDVVSLTAVNGGTAKANGNFAAGASSIDIDDLDGFYETGEPLADMTVWYFKDNAGVVTLTDTGTTVNAYNAGTLADDISDNEKIVININPFYIDDWAGDPNFLEDKFVRFSYRFRYEDGEYSIFAPFTQIAFMSKQNGFFLGDSTTGNEFKDEDAAYRSSVVEFMENAITNIQLRIPMPNTIESTGNNVQYMDCNQLSNLLKISEIDILYREAGSLPVKVLETIGIDEIQDAGAVKYFEYNYQSRKPFKTLPESELVRVFDKIPVRAKTQEIISNRVVYGNYVDKLTPPTDINYNVGISDKFPLDIAQTQPTPEGPRTSIVEYPQHSVKHNRNYQVGIILSDRYGRQSSVILSSNKNSATQGGINFGGSTFYASYRREGSINNESSVLNWPGDSIKMVFNDIISRYFIYIVR